MIPRPKVAVVGVGAIGRHHCRILAAMPDVELAAVADPDPAAIQRAGVGHLPYYQDAEGLLERERLDAVIVAAPSFLHASIATSAIQHGVSVLVEKPIASTLDDAELMIRRAEEMGVILAVGHVERFNPAVVELKSRLDAQELGRLFLIEVRREGPFPERISDVGVTVDLATHDLDVLGYLLQSTPEMVFAQVAKRVHGEHEDLLTAILRYSGGVLVTLDVNWLTPRKVRHLTVTGEKGSFDLDYLLQYLVWYENSYAAPGWDRIDTLRGVGEGRITHYPIHHQEPLAVELAGFLSAIRGHGKRDIVTGTEGARSLALALALLESAKGTSTILRPLERVTMREGA